jgi:hypothetical protein
MGFFKRERREVPPRNAKISFPAFAVRIEDLPQADAAVSAFIASVGNDPKMRMCARDLSLLGGSPRNDQETVRNLQTYGDAGLSRPWDYLAECAEVAQRAGDPLLAARIGAVMSLVLMLAPRLTLADWLDFNFDKPKPDQIRRIAAVTLQALAATDPQVVVVDRPGDSLRASQLAEMMQFHSRELS